MPALTEETKALLRRPVYAWATTIRADGSPHNTVVWLDVDGEDVIFNTAVGRAKERHLRRNPLVAVSALDPENPYHFASVSGVAQLELDDADGVIDGLAKKYLGVDSYPGRRADEQRITVRIPPEKVIYSAGR
jgi:PPOX class probable F420-dependent enzyme